MSDEQLDRMVRDADPYRPGAIRHLDEAAQDLLEEIMSVPTPSSAEAPVRRLRPRRAVLNGLAGASVAATLLAGVLVVSTMRGQSEEPAVPPTAAETMDPEAYSAMVLKAAEENPRLLIEQPGWTVTSAYGFAEKEGSMTFSNGGRELEITWYPASQHDSYYRDRLGVSAPEEVKIDGWPADLFRYSDSDFAAMLRPREGSFVEFRTGGAWTRSEFDRVLADVVRVDTRTWLAALPAGIVTPERVNEQAAKILADVPLPPGFDATTLLGLGVNDAYQFGARVTSRVGCAWIAEWLRAKEAGDDAARQRAADAMRSSHNWKVLHEMNEEGDWPEVFWEVADEVAAGKTPAGYTGSLGCE
ncbi:hypothetical protein QQG74_10295 [Micromonospora sp. FIMYZ51]|uniref:hypothetical protein n=1 Tax=Micromonospora sp. FIMYZ51 TaxID=3051832 RepID=UPI00311F7515